MSFSGWLLRALAIAMIAVGICMALASFAHGKDRSAGWSPFAEPGRDGNPTCGVRTILPSGAELILVAMGNDVQLVAHDASWALPAGQARVMVIIGNEAYAGSARVADPQTLVVESVTGDFLRHFVSANAMTAEFGGVRWSVDLAGSGQAAWAMADCATHVRRAYAT